MLVLTRKINERIIIGENIELEILGIRGGVVRLGIKAPPEVSIIRHELRERLVSDRFEPVSELPPRYLAWSERSDLVDV